MKKPKHHAGAGGFWTVQNEFPDPTVLVQVDINHCCAACIQMVLGANAIVSDQELIARQIGIPTATNRLAPALNSIDQEHIWAEDFFPDLPSGLLYLGKRTPWIAFMKDFGTRVLHAVVIDGTDKAGQLMVRDPWPPGTSYVMRISDFSDTRHGWTGIAVYAKRRRTSKRFKRKTG